MKEYFEKIKSEWSGRKNHHDHGTDQGQMLWSVFVALAVALVALSQYSLPKGQKQAYQSASNSISSTGAEDKTSEDASRRAPSALSVYSTQ